jgi:hypothetical protein
MIERLTDVPDDVVGFRMSGHVTRDEYTDVILPVFRERLRGDEGVRTLVVIDGGFEKFEPGALWEDLKLGLGPGIAHLSKWKRTALVSDAGWAHHAIALFGWMMPGEVRVFPLGELDEARSWVAG